MIFHCPYCGVKVAPSAQTCPTCTKRMVRNCPACAESIAANAGVCKYCGEEVASAKAPLRVAPRPSPGIEFIEEPAARKIAWEDTNKGVFRRWWGTFFQTSFSPGSVFKDMKLTGHRWPIGYNFALTGQVLVLVLMGLLATGGAMYATNHEISTEAVWLSAGIFTAAIPASFILITLGLYLGAFITHLPVMLFGGKGGFQSTLRIVGYSSGVSLWGVIPYVGGVMSFILQILLYYHGLRNLHKMSKTRTVLCMLFPFAVLVLVIAGAIALAVCSGGSEIQGPVSEPVMKEPF